MGKPPVEVKDSIFKRNRWLVTTTLFILVAWLIFRSQCPPTLTPIVSISDGQIQGTIEYSRNGTKYWAFRGIPYATPPLGKLRFEPPLPKRPWKGVRKTIKYPTDCVQFEALIFQSVHGKEDCLYLNVFTSPIDPEKKLRPVLVYLHGGGFIGGGSSIYQPDYLMDHDVVVVTLNYRLGPFGFLNLGNEGGNESFPRGNMGLKDQRLALWWLKDNVVYFGGDPNKVTLFGQSAGAASVHFHVLSPNSEGLFHRAISHSGTALCPWAYTLKMKEISKKLVEKVGCALESQNATLRCLQTCNAEELVRHQRSLIDPLLDKDILEPSIEELITNDTLVGEIPSEIVRRGEYSKVPYLMGVNSGEGSFRVARFDVNPGLIPVFESNWAPLLVKYLGLDSFPANLSDIVRNHYFGNMSFTEDPLAFKHLMSMLGGHSVMYEPIQRTALYHASTGTPTYLFYYNYRPFAPGMYSLYHAVAPNDWLSAKWKIQLTLLIDWLSEHLFGYGGAHEYGVSHGEDLVQVWNFEGGSSAINYWDSEFSSAFVQMIIDFVCDKQPFSYRGTIWPQVKVKTDGDLLATPINESERLQYMLIDNSMEGKMIPEPFTEAISFWRNLGIDKY